MFHERLPADSATIRDHAAARDHAAVAGVTVQDMRQHMAALAGKDGWTDASDAILLRALFGGAGLSGAAARTGRSREDCAQRFADLVPLPGSLHLRDLALAEAGRRVRA